ncbi:putative antirestriction adenine methyltransferase [Streptomyces anthocyanicus]|uniref:putative antirestriction adenine methyltransferase n=1 Tax=Streptomyces anthocyanicus TaxID=68174 RepID=UPI003F4BA4D1
MAPPQTGLSTGRCSTSCSATSTPGTSRWESAVSPHGPRRNQRRYPASSMETSDVTLSAGIVGNYVSGGDLASLSMTLDGEPVDILDLSPHEQAAHPLYLTGRHVAQARGGLLDEPRHRHGRAGGRAQSPPRPGRGGM